MWTGAEEFGTRPSRHSKLLMLNPLTFNDNNHISVAMIEGLPKSHCEPLLLRLRVYDIAWSEIYGGRSLGRFFDAIRGLFRLRFVTCYSTDCYTKRLNSPKLGGTSRLLWLIFLACPAPSVHDQQLKCSRSLNKNSILARFGQWCLTNCREEIMSRCSQFRSPLLGIMDISCLTSAS